MVDRWLSVILLLQYIHTWDLVTLSDFFFFPFSVSTGRPGEGIQDSEHVVSKNDSSTLLFFSFFRRSPPGPHWFVAQRLNVSSRINSQITDSVLSYPDKWCNYCSNCIKKMYFCIKLFLDILMQNDLWKIRLQKDIGGRYLPSSLHFYHYFFEQAFIYLCLYVH